MKKIVIIGLGLMGGSLASAISKKFPRIRIVGVARRKKTLDYARRKKWIHEGFLELKEALPDADLVVICTPVDSAPKILAAIDRAASRKVLVTDVGSVKAPLCRFAQKKKWKYVRFIGAHPMVGSHEKGIEAARVDLYRKGLTIITANQKQPGFAQVKNFWRQLSRNVLIMQDPKKHDEWVAQISHLPHVLSSCLMLSASGDSLKIASTGFRDMSRLAEGDESIWQPILSENKKAVLEAVRSFKSILDHLESAIKNGNSAKIRQILSKASFRRRKFNTAQ